MSQETPTKEEQLFLYLVTTFKSSARIAMGKIKNPMSDKIEQNMDQASFYIDLLDMIQTRTMGNLTQQEEELIITAVSDLKMSFLQEKIKQNSVPEEKEQKKEEQA
ncbi:MAG: DUF1844 domain-containing protein [Candidatus Marinimicrobia bacterium]|jgi:hypothetical protein|nr:DUF1844 domain-containing protein [Candidatus Neomarinimicrobiota bacterium]MBT4991320.1 DUF1844 domain-containing protein [Candidatus Neomarinimicrobiota bacterium]